MSWPASGQQVDLADGPYTVGIRPHLIAPFAQQADSVKIEGRVLVTELSGSESVIHFDMDGQTWVSQSHGIHPFEVGATAELHVDIGHCLYFRGEDTRVYP